MSMTATTRGGVEFRANAVPTISVQLTRETMRMITDEVVPFFDGHAETGGCLFGPRSNVLDRAHINVTVAGGPTEETEHGARSLRLGGQAWLEMYEEHSPRGLVEVGEWHLHPESARWARHPSETDLDNWAGCLEYSRKSDLCTPLRHWLGVIATLPSNGRSTFLWTDLSAWVVRSGTLGEGDAVCEPVKLLPPPIQRSRPAARAPQSASATASGGTVRIQCTRRPGAVLTTRTYQEGTHLLEERSDGSVEQLDPMVTPTRSFTTRYGGERLTIRAGSNERFSVNHEVVRRHPDAFKAVER